MLKIHGVQVQPLTMVATSGGSVLHMLRSDSPLFKGFGEVYFSEVEAGQVRAWKCHTQQTQNFAVPVGLLQVVLYDDRQDSPSWGVLQEVWLGRGKLEKEMIDLEQAGASLANSKAGISAANNEAGTSVVKDAAEASNYQLLQIPPLVWYGFKAVNKRALICNVVDMPHDPAEARRLDLDDPKFPYKWVIG